MELSPGSRVGTFEILALIGAGGMGEVYRARDPRLDREVALKILPRLQSADAENIRRFQNEAQNASALNHPNIVTIYDTGEVDGSPYIVMELISGSTLRQILRSGPMPMPSVLRIASKIADGLAAAHTKGIVHRDLKPENVMITDEGFVKILDFGLAKLISPAEDSDITMKHELLTSPGTILGTVQYMSPEQAKGRPIDFRSDQFAFGTMLYEMVTGTTAFARETTLESLVAIVHDEPQPLARVAPAAPFGLRNIVRQCMTKDRDGRYASTLDLAREVRALRGRHEQRTGALRSLEIPLPESAPARYAIGGVLLALLIAGGSWLWLRPRGDAPPAVQQYLAVLPFREMSGDASSQSLADGMSDFVSMRLATVKDLQVMPPAMIFDRTHLDARSVARQLGTNLVLQGIVQKEGDQIRVSYSITDTERSVQVASETFNGSTNELFAIEDKIADGVRKALQTGKAMYRPESRALTAPGQQETYLRALGLLDRDKDETSIDDAIRQLTHLAQQTPGSALVQAELGRAYLLKFASTHEKSYADMATQYVERAVHLDPNAPESRLILGRLRTRTGRAREALPQFQSVLLRQPTSADAIAATGDAYNSLGQRAEAEKYYRRAMELRPAFWLGYNKLGAFYFAGGEYDKAIPMFQRVSELLPDSPRGFTNLGGAYQMQGRMQEALQSFAKSLAISPSGPAYSNIGTCQFQLGHLTEAAAAYEEAARLSPRNATYWANLGDALRLLPGKEDGARGAYEHAIECATDELHVDPRHSEALVPLARARARVGQIDKAKEAIDKALSVDAHDASALYTAAIVANTAGDTPGAIGYLGRWVDVTHRAPELSTNPELAGLRTDPAFQSLLSSASKQNSH